MNEYMNVCVRKCAYMFQSVWQFACMCRYVYVLCMCWVYMKTNRAYVHATCEHVCIGESMCACDVCMSACVRAHTFL